MIDRVEDGEAIQQYLKDFTGRGTVPNIFIDGSSSTSSPNCL